MDIAGVSGPGSLGSLYGTARTSFQARQDLPPPVAGNADTVKISQAARDLLAAAAAADAPSNQGSAASASSSSVFDTDKGRVELDFDDYFSATPRSSSAGLPPLLMPTQENIDALNRHVSENFPKFLSDNGIPFAPASITYDTQGRPVFPADYPYSAQLGKAFESSPTIAREISTAYALTDSKAALDDAMEFQEAYRRASNMQELQAVITKYSSLLSGTARGPQTSANFTADGHMSLASGSRIIAS